MKNTRVMVTQKSAEQVESDLLVYCPVQRKKTYPKAIPILRPLVKKAFDLDDFSGKKEQQLLAYADTLSKKIHSKRVLLIGLGDVDDNPDADRTAERLRGIGGKIAAVCKELNVASLTVDLPFIKSFPGGEAGKYLCEGMLLGDYRFEKYKADTKKKTDYVGIKNIRIACGKTSVKSVRKWVKQGVAAAMAVSDARDMANEPGNGWTSVEFAQYAQTLSKTYKLKYRCLEKKDMKKLGMGGILAVNQGSAIPPKMVVLDYNPGKKSDTILLVGKGITFDSGGISIKPAAGMQDMKYDMCGGAAVLGAIKAAAEEKLPTRVIAIVPATDNMSGSGAVRPGDIIHHFNGVTSEIVNTDAEGRMILGDALSWGIKEYSPDCVIDVATLTGAVIIGLGHHYSGMVSNNDRLCEQLISAGNQSGEPVWRLPLNDDYKKQIKSDVADIKNIGGRPAGTITAAAYLSNFVGDTPWAHLDIAGTAWDFTKKTYVPKGPSGICVRTFLYMIRNWKTGQLNK